MEQTLRTALIGYRRGATKALFASLEQEAAASAVARESELQALSQRMDDAMAALHEAEAMLAAEQEQHAVLMALLDEVGERGTRAVDAARAAFNERQAEVLGEIARRELILGHRRQLLYTLQADVTAAVRRAREEIERSPLEGRATGEAGAEPAAALGGKTPPTLERAGA